MAEQDRIAVRNNGAAHRFEVETPEGLARIDYRLQGDVIAFLHTEVPEELDGRGIGSAMTKVALEHAREQQLKVRPLCPFVAAYIQRHPEYQELVVS